MSLLFFNVSWSLTLGCEAAIRMFSCSSCNSWNSVKLNVVSFKRRRVLIPEWRVTFTLQTHSVPSHDAPPCSVSRLWRGDTWRNPEGRCCQSEDTPSARAHTHTRRKKENKSSSAAVTDQKTVSSVWRRTTVSLVRAPLVSWYQGSAEDVTWRSFNYLHTFYRKHMNQLMENNLRMSDWSLEPVSVRRPLRVFTAFKRL